MLICHAPAAGEALVSLTLGAIRTCAANAVCVSRAAQLGISVTATLAANSNSTDDKKVVKPVPNTSGSETGTPNNGDDENDGKQAKKLSDNDIVDLTKNPNWHKTSLKSRIAAAYTRELRGSRNFDFYRDPKTGNIFIKGNQSNNMVKIDISRFLK